MTGKKISYVNVSEEDTRVGLKAMGWDDWLIDTTLQLFDLYRKGYASRVSSEVEEILGRRPTETNILHTVCQRLRSGFQIASCIC